jgi:hypothetical protein
MEAAQGAVVEGSPADIVISLFGIAAGAMAGRQALPVNPRTCGL